MIAAPKFFKIFTDLEIVLQRLFNFFEVFFSSSA